MVFTEILSLVVKMTTIKVVLSMIAMEDLYLKQMDIKTAFIHGDLDEELYIVQPHGYVVIRNEELVRRLRRSLYGLK
ncbi:Retrovirus-related Pol polyprotein from transposon TNT 1-94 [Dendrobium catenatum]|uniref:Retrovirus-related Pol polyprotein from transposon TNT 1-94 n=1 Tax=Dendrobium catenatum TaxID=906689 RepID=A0A2I0WFQ5_9ASPA|nr:Retrovirus-related Pol polyprotein from transposon TNT 1-94 [Dendrobium catenatum]